MPSNFDNQDIDHLLNSVFDASKNTAHFTLKELFEQRLELLNIKAYQALKIIGIESRALGTILDGTSTKIDFLTIAKLSQFLEIPTTQFINKYFQSIGETYNDEITVSKRKNYIINHFDLNDLKKIGFIKSTTDFDHIETRILEFFGYDSIFQFGQHKTNPAFSNAKTMSNTQSLSFWVETAEGNFNNTPNNYTYDRPGLLEYFPTIRWNSMNVENGLRQVVRTLFKFGVTVIYVPKFFSSLHVRGATMSVQGKPCIALTNYRDFYPTLWFALIHELYHVLYDWEAIQQNHFHVSSGEDSIDIKEKSADHFARQYLFGDSKMDLIKDNILNSALVAHFAEQNHIHPSLIYAFYAYDHPASWPKFKKYMPDLNECLNALDQQLWNELPPIRTITSKRIVNTFNTI